MFGSGYLVNSLLHRTQHTFIVHKHIDQNTYVIEQTYDGVLCWHSLTLIAGNGNDGYSHFYLDHDSLAWRAADVRKNGQIIEIVKADEVFAELDLKTSITTHLRNNSTRDVMSHTDKLPEF